MIQYALTLYTSGNVYKRFTIITGSLKIIPIIGIEGFTYTNDYGLWGLHLLQIGHDMCDNLSRVSFRSITIRHAIGLAEIICYRRKHNCRPILTDGNTIVDKY